MKTNKTNKELNRLSKLMELALDRFTPVEIFEALMPFVDYNEDLNAALFEELQNAWELDGIVEQLTDNDSSKIVVSAYNVYDKREITALLKNFGAEVITAN